MGQKMLSEKSDSLMFPLYNSEAKDRVSEGWKQNVADWTEVLRSYQEGLEWCASQGAKHHQERHKDRGLLLGTPKLVCE